MSFSLEVVGEVELSLMNVVVIRSEEIAPLLEVSGVGTEEKYWSILGSS